VNKSNTASGCGRGIADLPGLAPGADVPISLPPERLRVFNA
jgi:hypothetical protein